MQSAKRRPKKDPQGVVLYPVSVAAERMGCSDMHVYRQIAAGQLRAVDIASPGSGRPKTRIRSDDLADYIERNTRGTHKADGNEAA